MMRSARTAAVPRRVEAVYTEHMFEHILPMACAAFLKEAWRACRAA